MQLTLMCDHLALDAAQEASTRTVTIPAGTHEVERIPNPCGAEGDWLVLKGTKIGKAEEGWAEWVRNHPDQRIYPADMEVVIAA